MDEQSSIRSKFCLVPLQSIEILNYSLVGISILIIILLGGIALLSTGMGQAPNITTSTSTGTSLSTQTTQTTLTTFAYSGRLFL
jgi:hypothetical protein